MCKSNGPQAGCFVEHSAYLNGAGGISRHGCIEMLPPEERVQCLERAVENSLQSRNAHQRGGHGRRHQIINTQANNKSIVCCLDDGLCNYVKPIITDDSGSNEQQYRNSHHDPSTTHHRHQFPESDEGLMPDAELFTNNCKIPLCLHFTDFALLSLQMNQSHTCSSLFYL